MPTEATHPRDGEDIPLGMTRELEGRTAEDRVLIPLGKDRSSL